MIHREAELQRAVEQVRLGESELDRCARYWPTWTQREGLAFAEQVVRGVVDADERAGQSADAAGQADAVLALLLHLQGDVDRAVLVFCLISESWSGFSWLEVLQLVQAQQAQLPQVAVVDLALFQRQFAADNLVAGGGVALELDAADVELLAFVQVDASELMVFFSSSGSVFGTGVKLM